MNNNRIGWTIEDANNGVFCGLNGLMKFYLAGNKINAINSEAFVGLQNLSHLNLSNNNITSIQRNAFLHLPNLKVIKLNKCVCVYVAQLKLWCEVILLARNLGIGKA